MCINRSLLYMYRSLLCVNTSLLFEAGFQGVLRLSCVSESHFCVTLGLFCVTIGLFCVLNGLFLVLRGSEYEAGL